MKIAIIVPYFGKLPNYFQIFLNSCSRNSDFNWIIFTDDNTEYTYPSNVLKFSMDFNECKALIQSKFPFNIALSSPQKLCDFKCAYGMIFQEYLSEYDWWGHCDLDQVFGNLKHFITPEMLEKYDKLFSLGHLTLYKNSEDNNHVFMEERNGKKRFEEVFKTDKGCGFDEWLPENINEIYMRTKRPVSLKNICADINPYKSTFSLVEYDIEEKKYVNSSIANSIFSWKDGCLYQLYLDGNAVKSVEYPYVHLQKRTMSDMRSTGSEMQFYIIPNRFVDGDIDPKSLLKSCKKFQLINFQFFKVKWKSLRYRMKSGDWKFSTD